MEPAIKSIGSFLPTDADGYLVNVASKELIQEQWQPIADQLILAYQKQFGKKLHSVYVRGSVARGQAIDGISDVDSMALVLLDKEQIKNGWRKVVGREIETLFPFCAGVELVVCPLQSLQTDAVLRLMLKTQSVCVFGEDISPQLPKMKLGRDTIVHAFKLKNTLRTAELFLQTHHGTKAVKQKCRWIMKMLLRTGCELVMERSGKYTRDLYPCYQLFSALYPNHQSEMYRVLTYALFPTDDAKEILKLLKGFGTWLGGEVERVLGEKQSS